jgi:hypothetical protein
MGQCPRFRPLVFFHQTIPSRPLIHALKYFSNFVANSPRFKRLCVVPRYAGIALDYNPALCHIAQDFYVDPALPVCRIALDQNGIALDQSIKLLSHAV